MRSAARALAIVSISLGLGLGCVTSRIRYDPDAPRRPRAAIDAEAATRFLVYTGSEDGPGDLKVVTRLYRRADGAEVRLLPMVHFADAGFYGEVAARIAGSDLVLLEGAAEGGPPGTTATADGPAGDEGGADVFRALGLSPQPEGEAIGPRGPRYARGDIDAKDLLARVDKARRGERGPPGGQFPGGLFAWDRFWYRLVGGGAAFQRRWRHSFAARLRPLEDARLRALLIEPRDRAVLQKLDDELALRKPSTTKRFRIAIPWGSEHMAGIAAGLRARGFAAALEEVLTAWRVRGWQ